LIVVASGYKQTEKEQPKGKRMGIGSPELRTIRAACVLPFAVAACLIGAPAAFADAVAATPPEAAVVAAVASSATAAVQGAEPAAKPADVVGTVTHEVAAKTQAVEQRVRVSRPAAATRTHSLKAAKTAVPPRIEQPRSHAPANAVFHVTVAHKPVRAPRTPSVTPLTIFDAAPVSDGGAAVGGAAGVGFLLLGLLAFAALSVPPDAFRRRIAPRARSLRPSSPLLQLERPD
jgi:hypothetical protein